MELGMEPRTFSCRCHDDSESDITKYFAICLRTDASSAAVFQNASRSGLGVVWEAWAVHELGVRAQRHHLHETQTHDRHTSGSSHIDMHHHQTIMLSTTRLHNRPVKRAAKNGAGLAGVTFAPGTCFTSVPAAGQRCHCSTGSFITGGIYTPSCLYKNNCCRFIPAQNKL